MGCKKSLHCKIGAALAAPILQYSFRRYGAKTILAFAPY
jgi:hypothetical protein